MILNDSQKLESDLAMLKATKFKSDTINQIFQAITNTEKPFIDIFKKCGMEVLAYAMSLSNLCQQEVLNRGYEKGAA